MPGQRRAGPSGGLAFEDDRRNTLAEALTEALASLEKGIRAGYEEQGIAMKTQAVESILPLSVRHVPKNRIRERKDFRLLAADHAGHAVPDTVTGKQPNMASFPFLRTRMVC
jgi:hypothetical protein